MTVKELKYYLQDFSEEATVQIGLTKDGQVTLANLNSIDLLIENGVPTIQLLDTVYERGY